MKNTLGIDGETAVIAFDPDLQMFRGEFMGLNGGADFYADTVDGLKAEGQKSLEIYRDMCREQDIEPRRRFSGKFNLRLDPRDHEAAVIAAAAAGVSLNEWIAGAIRSAGFISGSLSDGA